MAHYCCGIWSLALYLISYNALRYVGRPVACSVVYSRYSGDKHIWLQWQGISFDGSADLFWSGVPMWVPQGPVPASSRANTTPLAYSSKSCTSPRWKHLFPSAFLYSSMKSYMTNVTSFTRNNNRNPSFYYTSPLNASSTDMSHSFSFAFLKSLPFCKTRGLISAFKWSQALQNKVAHSTLSQYYSEGWMQSTQQIFYQENY